MALILIVDDDPDSRWVLLDLYVPEQDGFETLRLLRGEFPGSRIIAVSAGWNVGGVDGLRKARELGADVTIRKPIDIDAVRNAVAELL